MRKLFNSLYEILAIKSVISFFNDDSGRIISDAGRELLSDEKKMKKLEQKLENKTDYSEIIF